MKRKLAVVAVALALVAGGVTGWFVAGGHDSGVAVPYDVVGVSSTTTVTTSQLVHGTWDTLPKAPVANRTGSVGVWTGHEMVVWGGTPAKGPMFNDGAAYEPASRTWTNLPPSPLSGRYESASVMAGRAVFIWGGHGPTADSGMDDGATYDPVSRAWQTLPAGPHDPYGWAEALWTGTEVILLTGPTYSATQSRRDVIHAYSWDPRTRVWKTLPNLTLPQDQTVEMVSAVSTGNQIWVWPHWDHITPTGRNSTETSSGVASYVYDLATGRWRSSSVVAPSSGTMTHPLWTGSQIIIPTRTYWCGSCIGGIRFPQPGLRINPATDTAQSIPIVNGRSDSPDSTMDFLWTGRDLLAYNSLSESSGPGVGAHHPGEAAAWDPGSNTWHTLPRAPLAIAEAVSVWTGSRLIVWGGYSGTGTVPVGVEFVPQS